MTATTNPECPRNRASRSRWMHRLWHPFVGLLALLTILSLTNQRSVLYVLEQLGVDMHTAPAFIPSGTIYPGMLPAQSHQFAVGQCPGSLMARPRVDYQRFSRVAVLR